MSIVGDSSSRDPAAENRRGGLRRFWRALLRDGWPDHLEPVARPHLVPAADLLGHAQALALTRQTHRLGGHPHLVVEPPQPARSRECEEPGRLRATDPEPVRDTQRQVEEVAVGELVELLAGAVVDAALEDEQGLRL